MTVPPGNVGQAGRVVLEDAGQGGVPHALAGGELQAGQARAAEQHRPHRVRDVGVGRHMQLWIDTLIGRQIGR